MTQAKQQELIAEDDVMAKPQLPANITEGDGSVPFKPDKLNVVDASTATTMLAAIQAGAKGEDLKSVMEAIRFADERDAAQAFNAAFTAAQLELQPVVKAAKAHNNTYAKYDKVVDEVRRVFSPQSLSFRHEIEDLDSGVRVTCVVSHIKGHEIRSSMSAAADDSGKKNAIQSRASTVTYLKRYTLEAVTGLVTTDDDDDGNSAGAKQGDTVSEDQLRNIREAFDSLEEPKRTDIGKKILLAYSVDKFADLPAAKYGEIMNGLAKHLGAKS